MLKIYKLNLSKETRKELKVIRDMYGEQRINDALSEIREYPIMGKPLTRELTGSFSYRIGVYRIIYKINEKEKLVDIITAGHRATVYE